MTISSMPRLKTISIREDDWEYLKKLSYQNRMSMYQCIQHLIIFHRNHDMFNGELDAIVKYD